MNAAEPTTSGFAERRWVVVGLVVAASVLVGQAAVGFARDAMSDELSHLEMVETCLVERQRPVERIVEDPVATSAERGALRTNAGGNPVTVALGGSEKDAERIYRAYSAVAPEDVVKTRLERRRKVVLLWEREPTTSQREFMYLCTLDAQE